jgi:threonine synthase
VSVEHVSLACIRCGTSYEADIDYFGCAACADGDVPVNLEVEYAAPLQIDPGEWERRPRGLWRYDSALPVKSTDAVSLGEGATALVPLANLGPDVGLPFLAAKNESQNPTWSFKDRLGAVAVSWAGAHPIAIEGCKTIAYELAQDLGWTVPEVVVIPVCYGDSLSGIYRGFRSRSEQSANPRGPPSRSPTRRRLARGTSCANARDRSSSSAPQCRSPRSRSSRRPVSSSRTSASSR